MIRKRGIKIIIVFLVILSIVGALFYVDYKMSLHTCEGWLTVQKKGYVNGDYYIFVELDKISVRLKCKPDLYDRIEVNTKYTIKYTGSTKVLDEGKLVFIILEDSLEW